MSDFNLADDGLLLAFDSAYQSAYQQAAGLVTQQTFGLPTWLQSPDVPDSAEKTFIIAYQPAQSPTSSIPSSNGVPAQLGGVPVPTGGFTGGLVFDVYLGSNVNAIPQHVGTTAQARQTIEQTAVGYHVNEFGLAPGRLSIDAVIIYQGLQYAQVAAFFDFLKSVKSSNPLGQLTPPGETLFIDVYLGRKLSITLENIMIEEVAGTNNQAHVVLNASVLADKSQPTSSSLTQSGIPPSTTNLAAAAGLLGSTLNFLGVSLPI